MMATTSELSTILDLALAGRWHEVRRAAEGLASDPIALRLDAVALKALGDERASRALFARAGYDYDLFPDAKSELRAIHHEIVHERR